MLSSFECLLFINLFVISMCLFVSPLFFSSGETQRHTRVRRRTEHSESEFCTGLHVSVLCLSMTYFRRASASVRRTTWGPLFLIIIIIMIIIIIIIHIFVYIYIYIYTYLHTYTCVYIYIYIYILCYWGPGGCRGFPPWGGNPAGSIIIIIIIIIIVIVVV